MRTKWIQWRKAFTSLHAQKLNQFSKFAQDLLRLKDNYKPNVQDDLITFGLLLLLIVLWVAGGPPRHP